MSDDVATALREIVELLRQRNESQAALSERAEKRLSEMRVPARDTLPDYAALHEQHERDMETSRETARQRRDEDVEFRERLLAAIERQNALLSRLLERSAP